MMIVRVMVKIKVMVMVMVMVNLVLRVMICTEWVRRVQMS